MIQQDTTEAARTRTALQGEGGFKLIACNDSATEQKQAERNTMNLRKGFIAKLEKPRELPRDHVLKAIESAIPSPLKKQTFVSGTDQAA